MAFDTQQVQTLARLMSTADEVKRGLARMRIEVDDARRAGASWDAIGAMVGTSGEAARQRFSPKRETVKVAGGPTLLDGIAA